MSSLVSLTRVREDIREAVRQAMELAGFAEAIEKDAEVAVKPNLGWDLCIPGSVTSPLVLDAVLEVVRERTTRLFVVEAGQVLENIERVRKRLGLDAILARHGAQWVNLSRSKRRPVRVPDARVFPEIGIPEPLDRAHLLTLPVLKTHDKTKLSGAIKNQWGCIPEFRHNFHLVLDDALIDILRVLRPRFAVMDATVALEGDGPKSGWPRILGLMLASRDAVALDWVQGQIMGFAPDEVRHLALAAEAGLGKAAAADIRVVGEDLDSARVQFRRARSNLVSRVELACRRSAVRKLVFDTPLFDLALAGAKAYYYLWYFLGGGRRRAAEVVAHPLYGRGWEFLR